MEKITGKFHLLSERKHREREREAKIIPNPDDIEVFHVYDEKSGEFKGKKINYKNATNLQKKLFKLRIRQHKRPPRKSICGSAHLRQIYREYTTFVCRYFLDQLPLNKWSSYERMLSNFKDQLDREIIRRSIDEDGFQGFVDRRWNAEENIIEYRVTKLREVRLTGNENLDKKPNIKYCGKDFEPIRVRNFEKAVESLFEVIPSKPTTYQELFQYFDKEERKRLLKMLPLNPSLSAYDQIIYRILCDFPYSETRTFVDYWHDKKKKTFYFKKHPT